MSGIKSAYGFLSTLPLMSLESEKVVVNIPWMDEATKARAIVDWKLTRQQRSDEIAEK